jgi:hypothetical protein
VTWEGGIRHKTGAGAEASETARYRDSLVVHPPRVETWDGGVDG